MTVLDNTAVSYLLDFPVKLGISLFKNYEIVQHHSGERKGVSYNHR